MEIGDRNEHHDSPNTVELGAAVTTNCSVGDALLVEGASRQVTTIIILLALRTESEQWVRRRYLPGCEHRSWHNHFQA